MIYKNISSKNMRNNKSVQSYNFSLKYTNLPFRKLGQSSYF